MSKLREQLERAALMQQLGEAQMAASEAERWLDRVAAKLCQTEEFVAWLMEQDASSAVHFSPGKPRQNVEEKSDLELAKMFIAASTAG